MAPVACKDYFQLFQNKIHANLNYISLFRALGRCGMAFALGNSRLASVSLMTGPAKRLDCPSPFQYSLADQNALYRSQRWDSLDKGLWPNLCKQ